MTHMDTERNAQTINERADQTLTIVLDEGDPVLESIKRSMASNNIAECNLTEATGTLRKATLHFPSGYPQHTINVQDAHILRATGHFKISFGELFGHLHVATREAPGTSGQVSLGIAAEGLTLKFQARPKA